MKLLSILSVTIVFAVPAHTISAQSIEGAWEIISINNAGSINSEPQPSLMLFTEHHYSFVWSFVDATMRGFQKRWIPTDAEKIQRFGEIIVNTGTYAIKDGQLTVYPVVAKNPEFIGGHMIFDIRWVKDQPVLTPLDEYSFDGIQPPWVSESSGETQLTLGRIQE